MGAAGMGIGQAIGAWLVVTFAYFVRGITGAGSGLIAIPILVQFLPIETAVPMMLLLDFTASCLLSRATPTQGNWSEIRRLLPSGVVGVGLGTVLLLKLPKNVLLLSLGCFIVVFGLRNLLARQTTRPISPRWAYLAGLTGGSIGAAFGTGGPPYMIYLGHRIGDKSELRATFSRLFLIEGAVRIATFVVTGLLLRPEPWLLWIAGLTALWLGLRFGSKVHVAITNMQMLKIIGGLLVISGSSLIGRTL